MRLDQARLAAPISTILGSGRTPDSGFGALVRWLCYVHHATLTEIEADMGMGRSSLSADMRLRKRPLTGGLPNTICTWIRKHTGHLIMPNTLRGLSTTAADGGYLGKHDWKRFARAIRSKLNGEAS